MPRKTLWNLSKIGSLVSLVVWSVVTLIGMFGMSDDIRTAEELLALLWSRMDIYFVVRVVFLCTSAFIFSVLMFKTFGAVSSWHRVLCEWRCCVPRRHFRFGERMPDGWECPETQWDFSAPPRSLQGQYSRESVRLIGDGAPAVRAEFSDSVMDVACVEVCCFPSEHTRVELEVEMQDSGRDAVIGHLRFQAFNYDQVEYGGPACSVPTLVRRLERGWQSLDCDVRSFFQQTLQKEGYRLTGIRSITISGLGTNIAAVRLLDRRF